MTRFNQDPPFYPESLRVGEPMRQFIPDIVTGTHVIEFKTYPARQSVRGARLRNVVAWVILWSCGIASYTRAHAFAFVWDILALFGIASIAFLLMLYFIHI